MSNKKQQDYIESYLESKRRDYITDSFAYASYHTPNTMFRINNRLPELELQLPYKSLQLWLRCLMLLKRNHDPVFGCTITLDAESVKDLMSANIYFKAKRHLLNEGFLIKTLKRGIYIVNVDYASKLFKAKLEI